MRPLIVFSDITVDGFMAGPDNDLDFIKTYPAMGAYWTTADGDLAAWMNATPKVVLSTTTASMSAPGRTRHWPRETERTRFAA